MQFVYLNQYQNKKYTLWLVDKSLHFLQAIDFLSIFVSSLPFKFVDKITLFVL